jgi:hypothetical protein
VDLLSTDPVSGRATGLPTTVRRASRAMASAKVAAGLVATTATGSAADPEPMTFKRVRRALSPPPAAAHPRSRRRER